MAYIGKGLDNGVRNQFIFAATQGQTAFSGADSDGKTLAISDILYTDCFQNGVKLEPTTDYTVTLTSLTLVNAASLNDVVDIVSFEVFGIPDTVSASSGGTFGGGITATSYGAVSGTTGTFSGTLGVTGASTLTGIVGIGTGTGSPTAPLHVNSSSHPQVKFGGSSALYYWGLDREASAGDFSFVNANGGSETERLRILAGGGITFNGDTAAANALDDYEEGTWTPTLTGGTPTYSVRLGYYTKIGNIVSIRASINLTGWSGSGTVSVTGLPFSGVTGAYNHDWGTVACQGKPNTSVWVSGVSGSDIFFRRQDIANSDTAMAHTDIDANTAILTTIVFRVA